MIDPTKYGIEAGDKIRIAIEGVVEEGGLYDPSRLQVGGIPLTSLPAVVSIEPTVEILQKAPPKWHSAQVIRADGLIEGQVVPSLIGAIFMAVTNTSGSGFYDQSGEFWSNDELFAVEVIIQ